MNIKKMIYGSIVAAVYVALCFVLSPISFGPIQCRLAELLCYLAIDYLWAYAGVSIGCLISNTFLGGLGILDMIFGTLATIIACGLAYLFRNIRYNGYPLLSISMIVLINGIIVGIELGIVFETKNLIPLYILEVAIGELIVMLIGLPIYKKVISIIDKSLS